MGVASLTRPWSNSGRARGCTLPFRRTSCVSSMACVIRAGAAVVWNAASVCAFDCAPTRGAAKSSTAKEKKSVVRRNKDWSFIVCPHCRFEQSCKTLPAGGRPRSQGMILRGAAFLGLGSAAETVHHRAHKGYHTSRKHSLVPQDSIELSSEYPKRQAPRRFATTPSTTSSKFRHAKSDAIWAIPDASCAPKMRQALSLEAAKATSHFRFSVSKSRPQLPFDYSRDSAQKFARSCTNFRKISFSRSLR